MPVQKPTFSAVIPNYNHSKYVVNTLDAAIGQTVRFKEIIVIDDASTDNSVEVIEARLRGVPNARLIRNPQNMGVIRSCNAGLAQATGDFICYMSADDNYDRRIVEWCHAVLEQYPDVALVSGNVSITNVVTGQERHVTLPFAQKIARYTRQDIEAISRKQTFIFYVGATAIRRDAILDAGQQLQELRWNADWFLYLIIVCRQPFGVSPQEFMNVRQGEGQYSSACRDWSKQRPVIEALLRRLKNDYPAEYPFFRQCALLPTYDFEALGLLWRDKEFRDFLTPLLVWRLVTYNVLRAIARRMPEKLYTRARKWVKI